MCWQKYSSDSTACALNTSHCACAALCSNYLLVSACGVMVCVKCIVSSITTGWLHATRCYLFELSCKDRLFCIGLTSFGLMLQGQILSWCLCTL